MIWESEARWGDSSAPPGAEECPADSLFSKLLEGVLQAELEDAARDRARGNLSKGGRAETVTGFIELRVIEKIKEFRPELKRGVFPESSDGRILDDRRVKIELRAATHDSDAGVAEAGAATEESRG